MPSGSKLGQYHPAPVTWMSCVSFKWEWNIFPFEFMHPGETSFSHFLKILGQKKCFLGSKSPILDFYDCISFAVHLLILICSMPLNSKAEIILGCVHPEYDPARKTAVVLPHVGVSTIVGGKARVRICPIIQSTTKYNT